MIPINQTTLFKPKQNYPLGLTPEFQ